MSILTLPHPTPIATELNTDPVALGTLLLSSGKYFVLSRVDKSVQPEAGKPPYTLSYAGFVRDRTPDGRYFLIDVFGFSEEFDTPEDVNVGHRIIRLEDLLKATFYADFATMQSSADENSNVLDSLNLE